MATTSSKGGVGKVLQKLEGSVSQGSYYEAQQMYKTIYFRYLGQKKYDDVKRLLTSGALTMLSHEHFNEGTELANLLMATYNETHTPVDETSLDPIKKIFALYKGKDAGKESFMKAAIKWTATEGENKQGHTQLHDLLAESYYQEKEFGKASKNFLRGGSPERFAEMITEWCKEVYPSEQDLLVARAVLQYLCLSNLRDANIVYQRFLKLNPHFPQTPLINYIRFLLMTMEHDAYPVFDMLRKRYKPSIDRDSSLEQYLDIIAQVYFKVAPQQQGGFGNIFGDLMRSLLSPDQQQTQ